MFGFKTKYQRELEQRVAWLEEQMKKAREEAAQAKENSTIYLSRPGFFASHHELGVAQAVGKIANHLGMKFEFKRGSPDTFTFETNPDIVKVKPKK